MKAETLYDNLWDIENTKRMIKRDNLQKDVGELVEETNLILKSYENNPVFRRAYQREESVTETADRLMRVNEGLRRYLPRDVDKEHNREVAELSQLCPDTAHLKTLGWFQMDNPVTNFVYYTTAFVLLYKAAEYLFKWDIDDTNALIACSALGGALSIITHLESRLQNFDAPLRNRAAMVDRYINNYRENNTEEDVVVKVIKKELEDFLKQDALTINSK